MNARQDHAAQGPAIDILIQSPLWERAPEAERWIHTAIASVAARLSTSDGEVAIVLTDDSAIRALNRDWRGIDKPTNVLSFPAPQLAGSGGPHILGDIVIAYETLDRECTVDGKTFCHHLTHLAIHGFLHLLGYDHETEADAETMESLETEILAGLNIPDPYLERDSGLA